MVFATAIIAATCIVIVYREWPNAPAIVWATLAMAVLAFIMQVILAL